MSADSNWTPEDEAMMFDTIDRWLVKDVAPRVMEMEHEDEYPHEFVEQIHGRRSVFGRKLRLLKVFG